LGDDAIDAILGHLDSTRTDTETDVVVSGASGRRFRSAAPIRDMLPAAGRADFAASYAAALDEARRTWSLQQVDDVLEQWRRIAILSRSPEHAESLEHARRFLAGEDVPLYAVDLEALRRGEIPAAWPAR
jgi:hypothetical protein